MVDAIFGERRLADVYDRVDDYRSDLDVYERLVDELGARSVLDVGCGTGTFACRLARRGLDVVGVDPAEASLAVARRKRGAERVRWLRGDATVVPALGVDLATMTANVAQVFVADDDWAATLRSVRAALGPAGALVFETRVPAREAWREWDREHTFRRIDLGDGTSLDTWIDLTEVAPPLVSFRHTFVFGADGAVLTSESTLRFRSEEEVRASLAATGFAVREVRDAPDRPGREHVFICARARASDPERGGDDR
jgi:SAM-dependent methyltransferase